FVLGLEFSLSKLIRVAPTAGVTALFQGAVMTWLGFLAGRALGWTLLESIFAGAAIAISSTTIVAKVFDERKVEGRLRELVVGILLFQDLVAVVIMAALTAIATGVALTAGTVGGTLGRLAFFLVLLVGVGLLVVPRLVRTVLRQARAETIVVTSVALCFGLAYLAHAAGYSEALGAFLAGSLVAESGRGHEIERHVLPIRDLFAAIFFVSVGLMLDPAAIAAHWGAALAFTMIVIVGNLVGVSLGAFVTGAGSRTALQAGMSLGQIGEFSFIIAGLGLSLGATRGFLYSVVVAVSVVTTLTTPFLIGASDGVASWVDRKLPHALQTYAALYGAWLERLRTSQYRRRSAGVWRVVRLLTLDTFALAALLLTGTLAGDVVLEWMTELFRITEPTALVATVLLAAALGIPLVVGIGRLAGRLGRILATTALPKPRRGLDFDASPRRMLERTIQLMVVLVAAVVILAVTQPFLPNYAGAILFLVLLAGFGISLWRSAADLDGHVRAGSEAVVDALKQYALPEPTGEYQAITKVQGLMHGLGATAAIQLTPASRGVGRSLGELDLRGKTGATVLAIRRGGVPIPNPRADQRLQEGDILAVTGTADALDAARAALI
ncbi:MAG TPA: cation:proton antiporter, partial [Gemmatimonadales bacterium]|nr:cation:proton antiporter [Gemmatimonadales bacterium]